MGNFNALTIGNKHSCMFTDNIAATNSLETNTLTLTRSCMTFTAIHCIGFQVTT
ncbi:hypothetical protein D3C80_2088270 [compost metagenome]